MFLVADYRHKFGVLQPRQIEPGTTSAETFLHGQATGRCETESTLEMVAYRDMWGKGTDSYLHMMFERLSLMKGLLSEKGSIYVQCDWRVTAILRSVIDEVFGIDAYRNEVIWHYQSGGRQERLFSRKHDTIHFVTKTEKWSFDAEAVGLERGAVKRNNMKREVDKNGRVYFTIKSAG